LVLNNWAVDNFCLHCFECLLYQDLGNFCLDRKAVFPGIEAFEMGVEIPILYVIFYDYFYKCSLGDVRWKKACWDETNKSAPLGPPQAEAFAMMQLKNNYFAWLLEAKEKSKGELITDYDPDNKRTGMRSAAEAYLKKLEINVFEQDPEELLVIPENHVKYGALKKKTEENIKKARRLSKTNSTYKEVKRELETMNEDDAVGEPDVDDVQGQSEKKLRQNKRRKTLKKFREYTVKQDTEGKFKGWSNRATEDMAKLCKKIREGKEEYAAFRRAYREIVASRNQGKKKKSQEPVIEVDYKELWDLGDIPLTEI
jgi:hypothetical protein